MIYKTLTICFMLSNERQCFRIVVFGLYSRQPWGFMKACPWFLSIIAEKFHLFLWRPGLQGTKACFKA